MRRPRVAGLREPQGPTDGEGVESAAPGEDTRSDNGSEQAAGTGRDEAQAAPDRPADGATDAEGSTGGSTDTEGPNVAASGGASDHGTPDDGTSDHGTSDHGTSDLDTPDLDTPDLDTPDLDTPDRGPPDLDTTYPDTVAAAPTAATRPRPTGSGERARRRAGSLSVGSGTGGGRSGTATLERPSVTAPTTRGTAGKAEREPSGGRFARVAETVSAAASRFGRSRRALPITLAVVIVVCLILSGLAFWQGRKAWTDGPVANGAVVDVSGTAEVVGQTREAIEKILSYDYNRLDDSVEAARTMSTGTFTGEWQQVFDGAIRAPARDQQLRQTATVLNIGVLRLDDQNADLMAVVQFSAERQRTGQTTNAPGLLRLRMERVDGRWKLAELTPLTAQTAPNAPR